MGVQQSSCRFDIHTAVACGACMSRHCTAAMKMSTFPSSSQKEIEYVATGRDESIPSEIGMVSGGILS